MGWLIGNMAAVEISIKKSLEETPMLKEFKVKGLIAIAVLLTVYKSSFFFSANSFFRDFRKTFAFLRRLDNHT